MGSNGNGKSTHLELASDTRANPLREPHLLAPTGENRLATVRPTVSVVIPTLNEAQNLPLLLPYLPMDWIDEVAIVDGRSTDGTVEVAKRLLPSAKIIMEKKPGKGAAMWAGYKQTFGEIVVVIDADGSHDPREIPRYVAALVEGADMAKGSRFAAGGGTTDMPRLRMAGNAGFVLTVNMLFGSAWTDLCYGFHAFWRHCLEVLDLSDVPGFEIDTALYLQAARKRLHVVEVPSFEGYRFHGEGKLQTFPDGFRVLRTIGREWLRTLRQSEPATILGFRGLPPSHSLPAIAGGSGVAHTQARAGLVRQVTTALAQVLATRLDQVQLAEHTLGLLMSSLEAERGSLVMLDEEGQIAASACLERNDGGTQTSECGLSDVVTSGLAGWVIANREPVLVPSTHSEPRWLRRHWDEAREGDRSAVVVPLRVNNAVVGVLTLTRPSVKRFTESDVHLLGAVSGL